MKICIPMARVNSTLFVTISTLAEFDESGTEAREVSTSSSNVAFVFSGKSKLHFIRFKKPTKCVEIFIERCKIKVIQIRKPYFSTSLCCDASYIKHILTVWLQYTIIQNTRKYKRGEKKN